MATIDSNRLEKMLEVVNNFGLNKSTNGINRVGYSDADIQARRWLMDQMNSMKMKTWMDGGLENGWVNG